MNFLPNVLHLRVNSYTFVISLVLILSMNHNALATTYEIGFERRPKRYSNVEKVKTHHCVFIDDFVLRADCESWSCWESQLRDFTRIEFLRLYNRFRTEVVTGNCSSCKSSSISTMIQLEWHWRLEKESQKAIKHCPLKDFRKNLVINVENNSGTNLMSCEMVATSFSIQGGSQNELLHMLPSLLNKNYLHDLNENNEYRRNTALYIGCSYVSRTLAVEHNSIGNLDSKGSIGHLLCYYCSKEETMHSNRNTCPKYTEKNKSNEFPELCRSNDNFVAMPCETKSTPCVPWEKSYSWMYARSFDVVAHLENGTQLSSYEYFENNIIPNTATITPFTKPPIVVIPIRPELFYIDPYDTKFCAVLVLVYILVIALMVSTILMIYKWYLIKKSRTDT